MPGNNRSGGRCREFRQFDVGAGTVLLVRGASGGDRRHLPHLLPAVAVGEEPAVSIAATEIVGPSVARRDQLRPFVVGWMPQRPCRSRPYGARKRAVTAGAGW